MSDSFPPRRPPRYLPATSLIFFPRRDGLPEDFSPYWPHGLDFSGQGDPAYGGRQPEPPADIERVSYRAPDAPTQQAAAAAADFSDLAAALVPQEPGRAISAPVEMRSRLSHPLPGQGSAVKPSLAIADDRPTSFARAPRLARASGSPTRQAAPAAAVQSQPASTSDPDYTAFPSFYGKWSKRYSDAPKFVPASQWNHIAAEPDKMDKEAKYGPYNTITFHHTSSENTPQSVVDLDRGRESPLHFIGREIKNLGHATPYKDNGDVTYHFLIDKDGTIYEGRSLQYEGAHVYGHNPNNIGVAFLGDYSSNSLDEAQVRSAKALIHALNDAYHVADNAHGADYIFTHKDLALPIPGRARPVELVGAQKQMDEIKSWSRKTLPHR